MRVLVTGGLGFVGQAVTRQLLAHGHQVTALSSGAGALSSSAEQPGRPGSIDRHSMPAPGADLIRADLRDRAAVAEALTGQTFDGVCHLAALTRVRDSLADPLGYFEVNLGGTLNLLHALDSATVRTGRFPRIVFGSTGAVYGNRDGVISEDEPAAPANPYGASKLAAEQLIGHQVSTGRLTAVTLRCFNIAGALPGLPDRDLTRIIPKTLAVAAGTAAELQINGDGSAVREYTHVLDVAEAFRLALESASAPDEHRIYNVGSGHGVTLTEVVNTARTLTGRPIPVRHQPPKPEARILMADSSRLRKDLNWHPTNSSLSQILHDTWTALGGSSDG